VQLASLADALDSVLVMYRQRNRSGPVPVTPTVKQLIETVTRRRFAPRHLGLIVAVDPARYLLLQRRVGSASGRTAVGPDSARAAWALTIDLATPAEPSLDGSAAPLVALPTLTERQIVSRRRSFRERLGRVVRRAHTSFLAELEASGAGAAIPRGRLYHPGFDLDAVALPEPAALPRPPSSERRVRVGDVVDGTSGSRSRVSSLLRFGIEAAAVRAAAAERGAMVPDPAALPGEVSSAISSSPGRGARADGLPRVGDPTPRSPARAGVAVRRSAGPADREAWAGVLASPDGAAVTPPRAGTAAARPAPAFPEPAAARPGPGPAAEPAGPTGGRATPDTSAPMPPPGAPLRPRGPRLPPTDVGTVAADLRSRFDAAGDDAGDDGAEPAAATSAVARLLASAELRALGVTAADLPPGVAGLSASLVARVIQRQRSAESRHLPERVRARDAERRRAVLPSLFDAVVGVLTAHRRSAMYVAELATKVAQNHRLSMSREEVVAGIADIAARAPAFCSLRRLSAGPLLKVRPDGDSAAARRQMTGVVRL